MVMEWNVVAVPLIGGILLGGFYFGGLWLTVKRLVASPQPFLVGLASFYGRMAVVIAGFYLLMDDSWERLLTSMVGFLVVRVVALRLARPRQTRVRAM